MKKILIILVIMTTSAVLFAIKPIQANYPHWDLNSKSQYAQAEKIETLIDNSKTLSYPIAIFDWDGTLSDEILPNFQITPGEVGEAAYALSGLADFFTWSAQNYSTVKGVVYPTWRDTTVDLVSGSSNVSWQQGVYNMTQMLEGHTNVMTDGYENFVLNSMVFVSGMDVNTYNQLISNFANTAEFSSSNTMFLRQLDVLQRLKNSGIHCFIVTGSSPYFVAELLSIIEKNPALSYGKVPYNFHSGDNMTIVPNDISKSFVIGNGSVVVNKSGKEIFTNRYNNFWTQSDSGSSAFYIVDGYGKQIVAQNIEKVHNGKLVFVAGNSNGDYFDMSYMLSSTPFGLGMVVNARGDKLVKLVNANGNRILNTLAPVLTLNTPSNSIVLNQGDSFVLKAWTEPVISAPGSTISSGALVFSSSSPSVSITQTGIITAVAKGNASIHVEFNYLNEFGTVEQLKKTFNIIVK